MIKYIPLIIIFLLYACEKKYNPDPFQSSQNNTSVGNLNEEPHFTITEYPSGIALNNTHIISLPVEVSKKGTYTITTDTVNNIYFNATGTFNNTGPKTVVLQGHGTPDTSGVFSLTIKYGTNSRKFFARVYDWWKFEEKSYKYNGVIDTAYLGTTNLSNTQSLFIEGHSFATGDTSININVNFDAETPLNGTYYANNAQSFFSFMSILSKNPIYTSTSNSTSTFKVVITNNDIDRKNIDATFEGSANSVNGSTIIANGRFRAKIRP